MKLYFARCAVLLSLSASAWAENTVSEQDYFQDFPAVLSSSRLSQPLSEAPNAMTVIDRNMIVASGFRNLADVFSLVPGMYVSYYKGSQPIVAYHGSPDQYARSMQVMIDGRSVYMPPANIVDWASLPITLDDVERIEVIRGPAAASYGANSVQGVINIISKESGAVQGVAVSVTHGNQGINDVSTRFGNHTEKFDYRMTVAKVADTGYEDRTAKNFPSPWAGDMYNGNDSNLARMVNYRATYYPNSTNNIDVQLGGTHDVQGVGFWDSHGGYNPFHDLVSNNTFQQLTWLHQLENASEFKLSFSHTRNAYQEQFKIVSLGNMAVNKSTSGERTTFEMQHTISLTESNRLVYGAGINREVGADNISYSALFGPLVNQINMQSARVFAHDEWRLMPNLIANIGGMYENDGTGNKKLSPRVSLNYHLTPKQTVRVGASIAYRTPSMVENYSSSAANYQVGDRFAIGNTTLALAPEKMLSREIGYLAELAEQSTLDMRVYRDQFENDIYPTNTGFSNGMSGQYDGVEMTLKHNFGAATHLTFNYAREFARSNVYSLMPSSQGDLLAGSLPVNTISAQLAHQWESGMSGSVSYYQQGALQPFDRGPSDYQFMHKRVDTRVAQPFQNLFGMQGEVAWVVQNLFNDNYTEYVASNVFTRRTYVTLSLKW